MKLSAPFVITSRLLPGLRIGGTEVSLCYASRPGTDGRTRYQVTIDLPGGDAYVSDDLQSGCQGGNLVQGFSSLLAFLGAAAESYGYAMRTGRSSENADLFSPAVNEWAHQNDDEISMIACEIEESAETLIDETS